MRTLRAAAIIATLVSATATGQEPPSASMFVQWQQANTTMAQLVGAGFRLVFVTHDELKLKDGESYLATTYYLQSENALAKCQEASIFNAMEIAKSIGAGKQTPDKASAPMTGFWCASLTRPYPITSAR